MVQSTTFLGATAGVVNASTPTALINPMTGAAAYIPNGGAVRQISIYRDGDVAVTAGCTIQFGLVGDLARYITATDNITTDDLNSGHVVQFTLPKDYGIYADTEMRVTFSSQLSTGAVIFETEYITYT